MRIVVMGAGALGSYFGGRLALAGHDVTLVARGPHLEAMQSRGLVLEEGGKTLRPAVKAEAGPAAASEADLVLLTVKGQHTREAASSLKPVLAPGAVVLSLQNGVDNEKIAAGILGPERVVGGVAVVYVRVDEPGTVKHFAGGSIEIAELDGSTTTRVQKIKEIFDRAGIPCTISPDLDVTLWNKLIWNCALNGLTALTGTTLDRLMASPGMRDVFRGVLAEAAAVARAEGVNLPADVEDQWMERAAMMGPARSSTLDDLERGRPLELDSLNGEVVKRAQKHSIPVPYNQLIVEALRVIEREKRG